VNPFEGWGIGFASPWFLLGLLAVPLLAYLRGRRGGVPTVLFSSTGVLRSLGEAAESRSGNFSSGLFYVALALLIVALARPQAGKERTVIEASGVDIVVVMDVSKSMLAEDFSIGGQRANRLEAIKEVTEKFIRERPHDRIGMVAFAGRPYLVSPLTLDHDWLATNLERVKIGLVEDGTAIGSALVAAADRLKDLPSKSRIAILLTDGDNNAGKVTPETAAEACRALGVKVYTIGAGSNEAAPFPVGDMFGRLVYQRRLFPLDEASLKRIAEMTGAAYHRATDTRSLEAIYREIDRLEKTEVKTERFRNYRDLFGWFAGLGLALLLLEMGATRSCWRRVP
jgi:Ca-activated chloride channel family protein